MSRRNPRIRFRNIRFMAPPGSKPYASGHHAIRPRNEARFEHQRRPERKNLGLVRIREERCQRGRAFLEIEVVNQRILERLKKAGGQLLMGRMVEVRP